MEKKNKVKRFILKTTKPHVKIGQKCLDCEYASKPTVLGARLKCVHPSKPKVVFHPKIGWICFSFSQKTLGYDETRNENDLKTELTEA